MWWLILLVIIPIPVLWWLLQMAVGAAMPPSASGHFYLSKLLKKAGVLHLVPADCVGEFVAHDIEVAKAVSEVSHEAMRTEMVKTLDATATLIVVWITGERWSFNERDFLPRTLSRYGVQRGALKQLTG